MVGAGRRDVAADLVGPLGEEADAVRGERHVPAGGILERTGRADRLQLRQELRVGVDQVGPAAQHARALARRGAGPVVRLPGAPRILYRAVDQVGVGQRHAGIHPAIGRAPDVHRVRAARHILPADEVGAAYRHPVGVETFHRVSFQCCVMCDSEKIVGAFPKHFMWSGRPGTAQAFVLKRQMVDRFELHLPRRRTQSCMA